MIPQVRGSSFVGGFSGEGREIPFSDVVRRQLRERLFLFDYHMNERWRQNSTTQEQKAIEKGQSEVETRLAFQSSLPPNQKQAGETETVTTPAFIVAISIK